MTKEQIQQRVIQQSEQFWPDPKQTHIIEFVFDSHQKQNQYTLSRPSLLKGFSTSTPHNNRYIIPFLPLVPEQLKELTRETLHKLLDHPELEKRQINHISFHPSVLTFLVLKARIFYQHRYGRGVHLVVDSEVLGPLMELITGEAFQERWGSARQQMESKFQPKVHLSVIHREDSMESHDCDNIPITSEEINANDPSNQNCVKNNLIHVHIQIFDKTNQKSGERTSFKETKKQGHH